MKTRAAIALFLTAVSALADGPRKAAPTGCLVQVSRKVDSIVIPRIDFRNVTVEEAIEFLRQKSKQLDPEGEGVNIVLKLPATAAPATAPVDSRGK
jgi:hypothetical protein